MVGMVTVEYQKMIAVRKFMRLHIRGVHVLSPWLAFAWFFLIGRCAHRLHALAPRVVHDSSQTFRVQRRMINFLWHRFVEHERGNGIDEILLYKLIFLLLLWTAFIFSLVSSCSRRKNYFIFIDTAILFAIFLSRAFCM